MMTPDELRLNRDRLVAWQREAYARPVGDAVRLHLGAGRIRYPGYINADPFEPGADAKLDMTDLSAYADNTVDEISCHHALEHIPMRSVEPTLREWYRVLKPGGRIDVGIPDIELCMLDFLNASETEKWNRYIWPIYGLQTDTAHPDGSQGFWPAQVHYNGMSAARIKFVLEQIGFKILEIFNYDANSCASAVWVLAEKAGEKRLTHPTVFEQDVVMGTFTHRTTYLPTLLDSVKRHLPHIPFVVKVNDGPINVNMELLRQDFIASGKRYWIFLDDDIQFLNGSIVHDAIFDLIQNRWAAAGVYSTFDPAWLTKPYSVAGLVTRPTTWVTGYFILVDSLKVGDVKPDMQLPDGNTSIDTSYSAEILARGYKVGLSANLVYHQKKQVWSRPEVVDVTNAYLRRKWGDFYHSHIYYDGNVTNWTPWGGEQAA